MARILFMGTPDFALPSLKVIHQHTELLAVMTQPDRPSGRKMKPKPSAVSLLAESLNISVFKQDSPQSILNDIKKLNPDCGLVVAYGQILKQEFLDIFPKGVINLHASLLPRWRGAAPIQRALMAGDSVTGVCLQKMVKKLDAGPLLGKMTYHIPKDLTADKLSLTLSQMGADLVSDVFLKYLEEDNIKLEDQNKALVTYAPKVTKEEGLIDFDNSKEQIFNQYRGLFIWPGVWLKRSGRTLKIKKMRISHQKPTEKRSGLIMDISSETITISCGHGSGAIDILELQPESKCQMTAAQYINGYPVQKGEIWHE